MAAQQFDSFEDFLKTHVPEERMPEVWRVLYGGTPRCSFLTDFSYFINASSDRHLSSLSLV